MNEEVRARLHRERLASAATVNQLRAVGTAAYVVLFFAYDVVLDSSFWRGGFAIQIVYAACALAVLLASFMSERIAVHSGLALPLLDVPAAVLVRWELIAESPEARVSFGSTLAVLLLVVIATAVFVRPMLVLLTTATAIAGEFALERLLGFNAGTSASSFVLLFLACGLALYVSRRIERLCVRELSRPSRSVATSVDT